MVHKPSREGGHFSLTEVHQEALMVSYIANIVLVYVRSVLKVSNYVLTISQHLTESLSGVYNTHLSP